MEEIKWWGYVHTNGSIQVKRYFEPLDIQEAHESPFVKQVFGPWLCTSREEAIKKVKEAVCLREDN